MIQLHWDDEVFNELQDYFNTGLPGTLYLSHYELSADSGHSAAAWKQFLTTPAVTDYITQELILLKRSEFQKVLKDISTKSRSVGTAQLLSALDKAMAGDTAKEGPAFVYCYIPLHEDEQHAPNVVFLSEDPFKI